MDWILWFGYTSKQKGTGALFKTMEAGHIHCPDVRWYSNSADKAKYLGVMLNSKLIWKTNVEQKARKGYAAILMYREAISETGVYLRN